MVTTNAGNSNSNERRPRNNRSVDGEKRIYTTDNRNTDRDKGGFRRNGNAEGRRDGEYKPRRDGEYKPRTGNGEFKPRNNNSGNSGGAGSQRGRGNGGYSNNGYGGRGFDKDKDEETPVRRSKPKTDSKPKEQQPDKFEIINRIEKEKKAMKKKHNDSKGESRNVKHTARPKRSGNIDWTREYENDSYDDDDLDMYL